MRVLACLLILLASASARAETVVPPEAFEQLSTGKTLYFFSNGNFFGAEQYFPDRKSIWQYSDGECLEGEWFAQGSEICFVYRDDPRVQCWEFIEKSSGYAARGVGNPPELDLELGAIDTQPLNCAGPGFGV
jgi:hypothetical protein